MDAEERRRLIAEKQALIRERAAEAALRELKSVRFIGYAEAATEMRADEKLAEIIRYEGAPAPRSAAPLRSAGERIETIAALIDNFRRGRLCLVPSRAGRGKWFAVEITGPSCSAAAELAALQPFDDFAAVLDGSILAYCSVEESPGERLGLCLAWAEKI